MCFARWSKAVLTYETDWNFILLEVTVEIISC